MNGKPINYFKPYKNRFIFLVGLLLLTLLALGVRIHHLDFESLFMDELRQVGYYNHSITQIVQDAASQQQPPLDYWIGHFVLRFFCSNNSLSCSDFVVRLPAVIFGVGSVVLITVLIARICPWPTAFGAGLIYAMLPFNIYFSQEARPYSIAIFFLLCVLWALIRLLETKEKPLLNIFLLFLFSVCFLLSRSLSPLVVIVVLIIILVFRFGVLFIEEKHFFTTGQKTIFYAVAVFSLSLLICLPYFNFIIKASGRDVPSTSLKFGTEFFVAGVARFDLIPMWKAFIVQAEPLGIPLLFLLVVSPFLAWRAGLFRSNHLWIVTAILLPGAGFLDLFAFQSKTVDAIYRPPYAIYLLPLTLILATAAFHNLWDRAGRYKLSRFAHALLLLVAVLFAVSTVHSTVVFKKFKRKEDWRGLFNFLEATFDTGHVLIFNNLQQYGWSPLFHYYRGQSSSVNLYQIADISTKLHELNKEDILVEEPVVIVLHNNDYFLTANSRYPFIKATDTDGIKNILPDSVLHVDEFNNLSVVRLKEETGHFFRDTYTILARLTAVLPQNAGLLELHLTSAILAENLGMPEAEYHLNKIIELTSKKELPQAIYNLDYMANDPSVWQEPFLINKDLDD